jgi:predicted nucleic acid-binding protein
VRVALDTNVLAYAEGVNGAERQQAAGWILRDLAEDDLVIPAQALAELFTVLTRKARRPAAETRTAVLGWHDACLVADTSSGVLLDAMELATSHQFALWDAIMLAAAAASGCRLLLSEDMHDGFTWRGVTIRNPFAGERPLHAQT